MPIVSAFFGIIIRIYYMDHNPPHFHAQYGSQEVIIEIKTGRVLAGSFPPRLLQLVEIWRKENFHDILIAWVRAQNYKSPGKIKPLE